MYFLFHFRSTRMKKALLFPIFKSFGPAERARWGRCMHLFLSPSCSCSLSRFYRCVRTSILNAANCLLRRRPSQTFLLSQKKREKEKKESTGKSVCDLIPLPLIISAISYSSSGMWHQLTRFVFDNTNNLSPRSFSEIPNPWFDQ